MEKEKQEQEKTESKKGDSAPSKDSSGPGYFEVIAIALSISFAMVAAYDKFYAPKIKVVDLTGFVKTQKALLSSGEITSDQWKKNLDDWEKSLNQEAIKHPQQVYLLKDIVLKNGEKISVK